ncbi:Hypothetical predicted protein [Cloeon dipterum]|uniref:Methyltransferase FkbM domain-containing protein n=1 Tax=Cloeon dipterum TaxID=197152 RepID=A0A8S1CAG6_9INSE|nr:Hypothetical predicted protein [Cloeon dipterum]
MHTRPRVRRVRTVAGSEWTNAHGAALRPGLTGLGGDLRLPRGHRGPRLTRGRRPHRRRAEFPHFESDVVGLPSNDERLVEFTRNLLIKPDFTKPYVLDAPEKNGGFFVECGAHEGEAMSNTILLERAFGWTGLLVEGAPRSIVKMLIKSRKAWIAPTCMSLTNTSVMTIFHDNNYGGRVSPKRGFINEGVKVDAICIPFNTLMRAMDRTEIDLFSLDVESFELDILRTINFQDVKINILCVEFFLLSPVRVKKLLVLMEEHKFRLISRTDQDLIYAHETYVLPAGIKPMVITEEEIMKSVKGVPF